MSSDDPPQRDAQHDDSRTERPSPTASVRDLLAQEATLAFTGLSEASGADPSPPPRAWTGAPRTFEAVVDRLPEATSGALHARNEFVRDDGSVDTDAIARVRGLDVDAIESVTGQKFADLAAENRSPLVPVDDHQDIVDPRRKALAALGFDIRWRWQIASDRYTIINPKAAFGAAVRTLRHHGETNVFGWAAYRDWGGLLRLVVICPGLERSSVADATGDPADGETEVPKGIVDDDPADGPGVVDAGEATDSEEVESSAPRETTVYGGFVAGYDFRGSQTMWARPVVYYPDSGVVVPDTGRRYSRKHLGKATDDAHERAAGRVPISEWWGAIYTDLADRLVVVDEHIRRARRIAVDFEQLPFDVANCYRYWGLAGRYADPAADRATALASPSTRPTVFNLQLSLLIALADEYDGSEASATHQTYVDVAGDLLRAPGDLLRDALEAHDEHVGDDGERSLPADQETLPELADLPGVAVRSEADLSDRDAQRLHDRVQRRLGDGA